MRPLSSTSEWRAVWLIVMFDLPTKTKPQKRHYHQFHNFLVDEGFLMLQYSIYGRHLATREKGDAKTSRVRSRVPREGNVRILRVTEAQFSNMVVIENFRPKVAESAPRQLEFW